MNKLSQSWRIFNAMMNGTRVNLINARTIAGTTRLPRCIGDIKEGKGGIPMTIPKDRFIKVETRDGWTRIKEYWIDPEEKQGELF